MPEQRICKRCVLPQTPPYIVFDQDGICNLCLEAQQEKKTAQSKPPLETDFNKILKMHKSKGKYDCLVMCSGGKDSTSSLYYMKERYKLNPLAFTFDQGFETDEALENVRKAVEKLGVDFYYFKSDFMKPMFARILKSGSKAVICHPCSIWYMQLAFDTAARYQIPIIVAGWTKGQSSKQKKVMSRCGCDIHDPEFADMAMATMDFLENDINDLPQYKDFPRSMEEVLKRANKKFKTIVVSPHWFLPYSTQDYVKLIQEKLDWKYPKLSYPGKSTNCSLNFISVHNSIKYFGYTHYHVEASKLIRQGLMTRAEALEELEIKFGHDLLNRIAKPLGYTFEK